MGKNPVFEAYLMTWEIAQDPTCNQKACDSNLKLRLISGCWITDDFFFSCTLSKNIQFVCNEHGLPLEKRALISNQR